MASNFRDERGRLLPGHPGMKPKGARSKLSRRAFESVSDNFDAIIKTLISKALDGETDVAKILLSIVLPKDQPVELAELTPGDLIEEIKAGNVTPDEAKKLAGTLKSLNEIGELSELRAELDELKQLLNDTVSQ
ncbi:MAG: hypothetical protein EOR86_13275 [Mesorhizobium sp.]|uniref:hypothetical protein n=1 Tax=Mesorhizobium sp. TaxID=1871066 RepID=UPI000FE682F4|nr:hypothetical protein [Mesorhizobium sp.]RWM96174.1 MAG: hypothetical protein EOR86_13275 [Mesorhizobium sp.]